MSLPSPTNHLAIHDPTSRSDRTLQRAFSFGEAGTVRLHASLKEREVKELAATARDAVKNAVEKLDNHHYRANFAIAAGSSAAILGGLAAITGSCLAPDNYRADYLTVGGMFLSAVGAGVSIGASAIEFILTRSHIKDVEKHLKNMLDTSQTYTKFVDNLKRRGVENSLIVGILQTICSIVLLDRWSEMAEPDVAVPLQTTGKRTKTITSACQADSRAVLIDTVKEASEAQCLPNANEYSVASAGASAGKLSPDFLVPNVVIVFSSFYNFLQAYRSITTKEASSVSPALILLKYHLQDIVGGNF
ncbi:hypothetical protein BaRGS_00028973 [Batillaria attramentaria]|uniref:Uncharacterized protein n=1 Tax=Batillaria attramentaria TaxID=370345 RepID=A0ABD0JY19_9CAEN